MGLSACPCDGSLDPDSYHAIVSGVLEALTGHAGPMLDRLCERMDRLAREQRYEEAGWIRDRHDALVRALRRRWDWSALAGAGWLELEQADGTIALIDHGRLVETRSAGGSPPLGNGLVGLVPVPEVPPSVEVAEEAAIIWRWLETGWVRLVECTGSFAYPANRIELTASRRLAA